MNLPSIYRCALAYALILPGVASATDVVSGSLAGQGGAAVAHPRDNSGITVNPASLSLIERYDFQAMFLGGPNGDLRWNASAVDGRTSKWVGFGLAYNGGIRNLPFAVPELPGWAPTDETLINDQQTHDITFALAVPVLERRLSFGVNGTLSIFEGSYVNSGVTGNIDLGVMARPVEYFSVGFVARDVLPIERQFSTPVALALGVRGGKDEMFTASFDVQVRLEDVLDNAWTARGGVEGTIKFVQLRAGWDWDGDRGYHRIGWGLGLRSAVGSIDYAMQIPVITEDFDFASVTHTVSLSVFTKLGERNEEERPIRWKDGG